MEKQGADLPLVRSSERGTFKNCPQSWYWSYVEGIVPRSFEIGAREFGTGIHLAMAEYYVPENPEPPNMNSMLGADIMNLRRGRDPLETWTEWCDESERELKRREKLTEAKDQEAFDDLCNLGYDLLEDYLLKYKGDPQWQVLAREETFAANIAGKAINVGTIDLVVRDLETGYIWIVDHKTAKQFPNDNVYRLDDQGGSYGAIATTVLRRKGLIQPRDRVKGIIFNILAKKKRDPRPRNGAGECLNKNGTVSKIQPESPFKRVKIERTLSQQKRQLQRIVDDVTVMSAAREGVIPILKAPGKLCPYCDFFQLCELDESGGDVDGMKEVLFKKRDPYHDHRDGAENSKLSVSADKTLKHGKEVK